jgi:protein-tyrosine phosphatase
MKVLFVCSGNAYRSPLAEALLKKLRPDLQVDSAGTLPEYRISREAREYSARQNSINHLKKVPEHLDTKPLSDYDLIIAMEQVHRDAVLSRCPQCQDKIAVWNIEDLGLNQPEYVEIINEQIRQRVKELADSLK